MSTSAVLALAVDAANFFTTRPQYEVVKLKFFASYCRCWLLSLLLFVAAVPDVGNAFL